ncbi:hypothetical protein H072_5673 [Dactylellina haptotyla CBS 200.50]|uniref:Uncharacterized protein n=1 Tax=Dactylellina haptotyla (strain CBS 200.50) TaxID=1284197 RepID=S8ABX1_DACHA|nr:hypothetical protein H072_5673 [Dactylellina haptotyla CBS 200.50]
MVLGLPCQFDYHNVTYAIQRTFGHLLPRRLQNRGIIDGGNPYDRYDDFPPTSPGGGSYNTSVDQVSRIKAREKDQILAGSVSGADVYNRNSGVRRSSIKCTTGSDGSREEVRWCEEVNFVDGDDGKGKRGSISRAV